MSDCAGPQHSRTQSQQSAKRQQTSPVNDREFDMPKRNRSRSGCLNCRRRRKKCDETKPICSKCASRGETCEWDTGFTFRVSGIDAQHPSMVQSRLAKTKTCEIVNVSMGDGNSHPEPTDIGQHTATAQCISAVSGPEILRESNESQATAKIGRLFVDDKALPNHVLPEGTMASKRQRTDSVNNFSRLSSNSPQGCNTESTTCDRDSNDIIQNMSRYSDASGHLASQNDAESINVETVELNPNNSLAPGTRRLDELSGRLPSLVEPDFTSTELEALDYLTSQPSNTSFFPPPTQSPGTLTWNSVEDPDVWSPPFTESSNATKFSPNAAYKNLHTTLYLRMVETARNTMLPRQSSPDQPIQESTANSNDAPHSLSFNWPKNQLQELSVSTTSSNLSKFPKSRQIELWRNYLDEVAVWLDMFDSERHFQLQIPQLAKSASHLQYSVLALSARQIERRNPERTYTESLGLYQEAIQLILQELHTMDTAVIASCVLLCVLEMMSSAPQAWSRHLSGCAMLLEAAGVNGVVGGVRQSIFWCFARMDVWGGFLEDALTKIPTNRWFVPGKSMVDAISHFKADSSCDSYANYAVFLCASVVNVISNRDDPSVSDRGVKSASKPTFSARWKALFDLLEDWYNRRPRDMQPIISCSAMVEAHHHPFPSVLYSNSPAINGNQLYHAATLLMLQEKPKDIHLPKNTRSILWHARQICGIAFSNHTHGPWINALQPLWIAGKIMSHASEHKAILEILASIERETGWATAWRAQDLMDYWGDDDG